MTLDEYLSLPGSLSTAELCAAIGVRHDAQIRQWRRRLDGRLPSPENCTAIEQATNRAVMRWDLRPDDWHRIWPELKRAKGAPAIPAAEVQ